MSQFSLYKNENKSSKKVYPYFVNVQSDLLDDLNSRIVIPLSSSKETNNKTAKGLCPVFQIDGKDYVLLTHQMTSVPTSLLKGEALNIDNYRYEILGAIDLLLTGI